MLARSFAQPLIKFVVNLNREIKTIFDVPILGPSSYGQCDQMVRLFFNIWPFATMRIAP